MLRSGLAYTVLAFVMTFPSVSWAFQLSPQGSVLERKLSRMNSSAFDRLTQRLGGVGLSLFSASVHEEITQRIYGCEGDTEFCADADLGMASMYIIAGVRWNDDPPFRLSRDQGKGLGCKVEETIRYITQPACWGGLFSDAKKMAARGEPMDAASGASMLHRSHFGDLQFLHAMASRDGETAAETQRKILMWSEFVWRTGLGEYKLETQLRDIPVEGFGEHFGKSEWRVQDLFTLGNIALRQRPNEVAFGSLLHLVQDSFANGHVDRREPIYGQKCPGLEDRAKPGIIKEFHAYGNQDSDKHGHYDSPDAFAKHVASTRPNVVHVGQTLKEMFEKQQRWEVVQPYLECVFSVENAMAGAAAGDGFMK